jgi:hypothetical protein
MFELVGALTVHLPLVSALRVANAQRLVEQG